MFDAVALELFRYQFAHNPVYQSYVRLTGTIAEDVQAVQEIPFLPISFFKTHEIKSGEWMPEKVFRSSGTTGSDTSRHFVRDVSWYHHTCLKCFREALGHADDFTWVALLPSYLERHDASLVEMVRHLMSLHADTRSGFFQAANEEVIHALMPLKQIQRRTILIGVSFALLDLFEHDQVPVWDQLTVIETGGMKGRGPEITRAELYERIRARNPKVHIISEYGMTELFSQTYRLRDRFIPGPTMKVFVRDISDPLHIIGIAERGAINIIDLANVDTCAFIATDDVGLLYANDAFEVLGRMDQSEIRGCNLMYTG